MTVNEPSMLAAANDRHTSCVSLFSIFRHTGRPLELFANEQISHADVLCAFISSPPLPSSRGPIPTHAAAKGPLLGGKSKTNRWAEAVSLLRDKTRLTVVYFHSTFFFFAPRPRHKLDSSAALSSLSFTWTLVTSSLRRSPFSHFDRRLFLATFRLFLRYLLAHSLPHIRLHRVLRCHDVRAGDTEN